MLKTAAFALETLEELCGFPVSPVHEGIAQSLLILLGIDAYG
jgi:hypothetical protein